MPMTLLPRESNESCRDTEKTKKAVVGTGGAFDFYELGLPLFDQK